MKSLDDNSVMRMSVQLHVEEVTKETDEITQ